MISLDKCTGSCNVLSLIRDKNKNKNMCSKTTTTTKEPIRHQS